MNPLIRLAWEDSVSEIYFGILYQKKDAKQKRKYFQYYYYKSIAERFNLNQKQDWIWIGSNEPRPGLN